jgi:hypothetical protein
MKKRIIGIWTLFGIICSISLAISVYFIVDSLIESSLDQRLMNVIGIPLICLVVCVLLGFGFHSVIENMKKDVLIDEEDILRVEELGQAYKKNGQPVITTLGFFLLCFIVLFVVSIYMGAKDKIDTWLMIAGIVFSTIGSLGIAYIMLYLSKQYNQDDYDAGLKYLRSLKDDGNNKKDKEL